MAVTLKELEDLALKLSARERDELVHRLIVSLDEQADGTTEEIARAWEVEITRRVAEIDAGQVRLIPADEVFAEVDDIIAKAK